MMRMVFHRLFGRSQRISSTALGALLVGACSGPAATTPDAATPGDAATLDAFVVVDVGHDAPARPDGGSDAGPGLVGTGIRWIDYGWPIDLTPDGSIASIEDPASTNGDLYLFDVATAALRLVTSVGDPSQDFATGMSAAARVTALHGVPVVAGSWTSAGGWHDEPDVFATGCDMNRAGAWDVSADGTVMVGFAWNGCVPLAYRWVTSGGATTATALTQLGSTGTAMPPVNRATVVSDDGHVAAGFAQTDMVDRWPAIWRDDGTSTMLPGMQLDAPGEVLAINTDGSVVAGVWNLEGFVWSQAGGVVSLGTLPGSLGGDTTTPNAVAAGGALVFGGSGSFGSTTAFVWTSTAGMLPLADQLVAAGITLPGGYVLTNVIAASSDGTVILGNAMTPAGSTLTFVARVPVSAFGL